MKLPQDLPISRSCDWVNTNPDKWKSWTEAKPECDASFYTYTISPCDVHSRRAVDYHWFIPDPQNPDKSLECTYGVHLPVDVSIDCEYMPTTTTSFKVIAVLHNALMAMLVSAIIFVVINRAKPIVKRSQSGFLVLMIVGGIMICVSALLYAGRPCRLLCAARPVFISTGFTMFFGSLVVKSLRVYRVFMKSALKRVTVTALMMLKVFGILAGVDALTLVVWFAADFPHPTVSQQR